MKAAALLPILIATAGCGGTATDPNAQATPGGVALPAAGTADAVRTAKPGTAPIPVVSPTPSPTASAMP